MPFLPCPKPEPRPRRKFDPDAWRRRAAQKYADTATRKPIKPRNDARAKAQFERAFLSEAYVDFVHSLGCSVPGCSRTNIECAHVGKTRKNGGKWYEIAPLCGADPRDGWEGHHPIQESIGTEAMNKRHGIDLLLIAAAVALRWRERTKGA